MKQIYKNLLFATLAVATLSIPDTVAQTTIPTTKGTMILLSAKTDTIEGNDTTFCVKVRANADYNVSSSANWITTSRNTVTNNVYIHIDANPDLAVRSGSVSFASTDGKITRTLTIMQGRDNSAKYVAGDKSIKPSSGTASSYQSGAGIEKSFDGNTSTMYHSSWSNSASNYFPITLVYNFTNVSKIDYLTYIPRQDGSSNGRFKQFELWVKCSGDADYTKYGDYDFNGSSNASTIKFGTTGLTNPVSIKFIVKSGSGDGQGFASCAEMQFFENTAMQGDFAIFGDDLYTTLKTGTTQADIDKLTNPFCKLLAQRLLNGTYSTQYRVGQYPCLLSPEALSDMLNAPGKYYDHYQNVTGINISKGKSIVAVSGIPEGKSISLKVVAWFAGELNEKGVGSGQSETSFALKNGINIIDYTKDYDGLAYISYYADSDPDSYSDVKVHFINGQVNGYLTPKMTNDEINATLKAAPNRCIDLVGTKVHSVWQTASVLTKCKASDGVSQGQRQFMNMLDSLVAWEQEFIGLNKYNYNIRNKTMAYVNYTYYMFQGWAGVSFMYDQEGRVLNCKNMMYNDADGIWGLSHEWGHQHQMTPYFCWAGQAEVTNNMKSCYNEIHMGYHYGEGYWVGKYNEYANETHKGKASTARYLARQKASAWNYCNELKQQALTQDSIITPLATDPDHAAEYLYGNLGPYYNVYNYFANKVFSGANCKPDFSQDLYESLRHNDDEAGSSVEKSTGIDKYELIASVQNNNKNSKYATLAKLFPNSCWVTKGYLSASSSRWQNCVPYMLNYVRKVSRISGYNLYPYFEAWGFFRLVNLYVYDYIDEYVAMTASMRDEFKADMQALVDDGTLKAMPDGMVKAISTTTSLANARPNIPN
jgi:hypothetical protein